MPTSSKSEAAYRADRAKREIALAEASGAKAWASADNSVVFVQSRDGSVEQVKISRPPNELPN
jgi:hypothetical protein